MHTQPTFTYGHTTDLYYGTLECHSSGYVITSLHSLITSTVSTLYCFGVSAGDIQLEREDDGSSPRISLSIPFRFFGTSESIIYVSQLHVIRLLKSNIVARSRKTLSIPSEHNLVRAMVHIAITIYQQVRKCGTSHSHYSRPWCDDARGVWGHAPLGK